LAQDGITPISITNNTNAFFVATLAAYRQDLNNGVPATGAVYSGNPCIYGVFDANTNKYIIAMEEINRYLPANFLISNGFDGSLPCYGLGGPYPNSVYAASSVWYDPNGPYVTRLFTDSGMTTPFNGGNLYYSDQYSTFATTLQIDNNGYVIGYFSC
jgi:hypothetical protein